MNNYEEPQEILYRAFGFRAVSLADLYLELGEIYDAASGLQLLLGELAEDLTDDGYEPARYLLAGLALRHMLELLDGLLPLEDRLGRSFYVRTEGDRASLVFAEAPRRV